jgi:hypothetical protein
MPQKTDTIRIGPTFIIAVARERKIVPPQRKRVLGKKPHKQERLWTFLGAGIAA